MHRRLDSREALLAQLRSTTRAMESAALPASAAPLLSLELTVQQLKLLTVLVTREGGATGSELAQIFDVSPATMSGLLDRLVRHGAAERHADPVDHRIRRIRATPLGRTVVQRLVAARPEFDDEILAGLSEDELAALALGMSAIARQLKLGPVLLPRPAAAFDHGEH